MFRLLYVLKATPCVFIQYKLMSDVSEGSEGPRVVSGMYGSKIAGVVSDDGGDTEGG